MTTEKMNNISYMEPDAEINSANPVLSEIADTVSDKVFEQINNANTRFSMEYTMRYFKHYKGNAYVYKGTARHSETLEDLVVYEARGDNAESSLWVRPKKMFFGQVPVDGELKARFEQIPLFVQKLSQISEEDILNIKHLCELCFGKWNDKKFRYRLESVKNPLLIIAYIETRPVAFKLGYQKADGVFYSWLGGVIPEFQRYGFAKQIASIQIDWCKAKGYKQIDMKTKNEFRGMIALNLSLGFDIVGTEISADNQLKILMEKRL